VNGGRSSACNRLGGSLLACLSGRDENGVLKLMVCPFKDWTMCIRPADGAIFRIVFQNGCDQKNNALSVA
jgi:hypothetical protein